MLTFTVIFLVALAVSTGLRLWLAQRQIAHVEAHREQVPEPFAARISLAEHRKAADYTVTKTRLTMTSVAVDAALLLLWTLGGGLDLLDQGWRALGLGALATGVGVVVSAFLVMAALELPLTLYRTFVVESRFGFNRMTAKVFVADLAKNTLLMLIIGVPLVALALWLMQASGGYWWIYVWLMWTAFGLAMSWAYPTLIAPLFNRFSALDNETLRARIQDLLERCGFQSKGVYVMDGSTRSAHGNAYFTGFGRGKRIVFFDTLIDALSHDQIESVLAHELGHFKLKHVVKRLAMMAAYSLVGLALLAWLMQQPWFYGALGVDNPSAHMALLLFILVGPVFAFFLQPLLTWRSRKDEFEADEFAASHTRAEYLIAALVSLYKENANTLTPDPLHSAVYDSHPSAARRIAHLNRYAPAAGLGAST